MSGADLGLLLPAHMECPVLIWVSCYGICGTELGMVLPGHLKCRFPDCSDPVCANGTSEVYLSQIDSARSNTFSRMLGTPCAGGLGALQLISRPWYSPGICGRSNHMWTYRHSPSICGHTYTYSEYVEIPALTAHMWWGRYQACTDCWLGGHAIQIVG
eukprot:3898579-Rhodomonas_salina.3